jgi:hypothetical protein
MLHIDRIQVGFTVDTDGGPERKLVTLANIRKHCRPERVDEMLEDMTLLCEDVEGAGGAGEPGRLRVIR